MKSYIRRAVAVTAICVGFLSLAASPVFAQVERVYVDVTPPALVTTTDLTTPGLPTRPLPLQVSSGAVTASQQAPVEGLAFTGADIATMVLVGMAAVAIGVVLTRTRPRSVPEN